MESELMLPTDTASIRVTRSKGKPGTKKVIRANPIRLGKDEMNLIEHPYRRAMAKRAGQRRDRLRVGRTTSQNRKTSASVLDGGRAPRTRPTDFDRRARLSGVAGANARGRFQFARCTFFPLWT